MIQMLKKEIEVRKSYLEGETVETIYFGGGTPSLLDTAEIGCLLEPVYKNFKVTPDAEVTLEANPEDLSKAKLKDLKATGVNRLSIGVQTFHDEALTFLNRKHTGSDSLRAIDSAQSAGYQNINIDLIYSLPFDEEACVKKDLELISSLPVQHVSAYSLTIEENTVFGRKVEKKLMHPQSEELDAGQFVLVRRGLQQAGFEQYEISNFARNGLYSKHNSSYWLGRKYLGIGPGAHSYNLQARQYNISNNPIYIRSLERNEIPATTEILDNKEKANDYILTGLRTKWGISLSTLKELSGNLPEVFLKKLETFLRENLIIIEDEQVFLTDEGKLLADEICMNLFYT